MPNIEDSNGQIVGQSRIFFEKFEHFSIDFCVSPSVFKNVKNSSKPKFRGIFVNKLDRIHGGEFLPTNKPNP